MKQHLVICRLCKQQFDANRIEAVMPARNQYYHKTCYESMSSEETQIAMDQDEFYKYCRQLYGEDFNFLMTRRIAERLVSENNFSFSGMTKALKWYYEIEGNKVKPGLEGPAILPYIYNQAKQYYYNLYLLQSVNSNKNIKDYIPTVTEITIKAPVVKIKPHRMFDMED